MILMRSKKENKPQKDDRYQFQPLYIRMYRRLKYQPLYFCKGVIAGIKTVLFQKKEDRYKFRFVYQVISTEWQIKANYVYTPDEVKEFLDIKKGRDFEIQNYED